VSSYLFPDIEYTRIFFVIVVSSVCGLDASGSGYASVMDPCEHDK